MCLVSALSYTSEQYEDWIFTPGCTMWCKINLTLFKKSHSYEWDNVDEYNYLILTIFTNCHILGGCGERSIQMMLKFTFENESLFLTK